MLDVNIISFLGFALLILGLSISAFLDLKVNSQMTNYWRGSLVLIAAGYSFFAAAPFVDKFFITLANSILYFPVVITSSTIKIFAPGLISKPRLN
jgi:hypothetical protein